MKKLKITIDSYCTSSEYDHSQDYGHWEEYWDHSLNDDVTLSNKGEPIDFDVNVGDTVYIVWAIWSSGNSFGWAHNGRAEVICVFKTLEKAEDAEKALKTANNLIITESGEPLNYYRPWDSYFENLESIRVESRLIV